MEINLTSGLLGGFTESFKVVHSGLWLLWGFLGFSSMLNWDYTSSITF